LPTAHEYRGTVDAAPGSEPADDRVASRAEAAEAAPTMPSADTSAEVDPGVAEGGDRGAGADQDDGVSDGDGESAEAADGSAEPVDGKDPLRFNSWMKRSATGAVMTGIAVGLQQALELPRQEPAFVIEASGEPDDPNRAIDLHIDPDNPAGSVAIVRRRSVDPPEEPSVPS